MDEDNIKTLVRKIHDVYMKGLGSGWSRWSGSGLREKKPTPTHEINQGFLKLMFRPDLTVFLKT